MTPTTMVFSAANAENGMEPAMERMPAAATRVRRFMLSVLCGYELFKKGHGGIMPVPRMKSHGE